MKKFLLIFIPSLFFSMILPLFIWAHYAFVTGLNPFLGWIFIIVILMIFLPMTIAVFRKLRTYWFKDIEFRPAMLFAIGLLSWIISSCVSYFFLGESTIDIHLHDTLYVIANFYIGVVISIFFLLIFSIYYWCPKLFKRQLNNSMGYVHFWITFIGVYLIFWPAYAHEIAGSPRRYLDREFDSFSHFQMVNRFVTTTVILMLIAQLIFLFNILYSIMKGRKVIS